MVALLVPGSAGAAGTCIQRSFEIAGLVRTLDGRPVADAVVKMSWQEATGTQSARATTAFDGSYRVFVLFKVPSEPGKFGQEKCLRRLDQVQLSASKDGYAKSTQRIRVEAERMYVNLTLEQPVAEEKPPA